MKGTISKAQEISIVHTESGMPTLKIIVENDRDFYLSPFRGYSFQVSGTLSGSCDYGSSEVIGLANVVKAFSDYQKPKSNLSIYAQNSDPTMIIFRSLINDALRKASIIVPIKVGDKFRQDIIDEFINEVIDWLHKLM